MSAKTPMMRSETSKIINSIRRWTDDARQNQQPPTIMTRNGVSHHAKIKEQRITSRAPGIPPKLWIGLCQAVCDQLGSEGLKA